MKTLSLKLHESLDNRLAVAAKKRGQTKSAVVREALEAFLQEQRTPQSASCLELAADVAGCLEGPADLSTGQEHMQGYGR
ncbi:MAG: ribbon-helix-helix protein, CopG family [Candidatus Nealsonbacteria bacterium]|nr:ribbon-helix-helix protein, CopG family [Candidatus Nealsonbacteria bacterium]